MNKLFGGLAIICVANLVPYLMTFLMLFSSEGRLDYMLASIMKSFFSIPTGILGYALQYDLGDWLWTLLNVLGIIVSIITIKVIDKLF
jgi:uncharacterized membrane protein HdeD (DUF308 family)